MTILIVVHNSGQATEISSILRRTGQTIVRCTSVTSTEFSKEFASASLVVTDLSPHALELLSVNGEKLTSGRVPFIVVTAPAHRASLQARMPDSFECLGFAYTSRFADGLTAAAIRLTQPRPIASSASTAPTVRAASPVIVGNSTKHVTADAAHALKDQTRRAIQQQDRFVSNIAHDLRSPLTAIIEFSRMIESAIPSGNSYDQARRYIRIIERRCQDASRMVDDLLDGFKLQSGRIHPHRQPVQLADILKDLRESLEPASRHTGVNLKLDIPSDTPQVFADRDMLGRIVNNLVSNAMKFSPTNETVTVRVIRQSLSMISVAVIDAGAGISPEDMRRIFRRFEQGSNRVANGVGLGLSIVRQLVKLHGGRVTAESTPGKGSRFQFTLPMFLPAAIVRRHLSQVRKSTRPNATIWGVTCHDAPKYGAIHRLITSLMRAEDLVLPQVAGTGILLITQAKAPQRLLDRLCSRIESLSVPVPSIQRLTHQDLKMWLREICTNATTSDNASKKMAG